MFKTRALINKWHLIGVFWIIIVGTLLHFTYEWSGDSAFVGIFSAINESVWEHLKLGYFALTFFILIEYWVLRYKTTSYFISKVSGIIAMSIFILVVHYSYIFIVKNDNLIVDIVAFVLGAIICQILSMNLMKMKFNKKTEYIGLAIYILIALFFVQFTFFTPDLPIFEAVVGNHYFFWNFFGRYSIIKNIINI